MSLCCETYGFVVQVIGVLGIFAEKYLMAILKFIYKVLCRILKFIYLDWKKPYNY